MWAEREHGDLGEIIIDKENRSPGGSAIFNVIGPCLGEFAGFSRVRLGGRCRSSRIVAMAARNPGSCLRIARSSLRRAGQIVGRTAQGRPRREFRC